MSSSAHWTSSTNRARGLMPASVEIATLARSNARRSLASAERVSNPGASRPEMASTTLVTTASAGVPAAVSRMPFEANRLCATRNGPRISSSAVITTQANPLVAASSAAASSRRVLPIPGSPSRVTADRRVDASRSSWAMASSSLVRPMTAPLARRSWTASEHWGPTRGSSTPPSVIRIGARGSAVAASSSMSRIMQPRRGKAMRSRPVARRVPAIRGRTRRRPPRRGR